MSLKGAGKAASETPATSQPDAGDNVPEWARRDSNARPLAPEGRPPAAERLTSNVQLELRSLKRLLSLVDADADCYPERYPFRVWETCVGFLCLLLRQRERLESLRELAWAFRELSWAFRELAHMELPDRREAMTEILQAIGRLRARMSCRNTRKT